MKEIKISLKKLNKLRGILARTKNKEKQKKSKKKNINKFYYKIK